MELAILWQGIAGFLALAAIEIVLSIDNLIFIAVATARLPEREGRRARVIGLGVALLFRLALVFALLALIRSDVTALTVAGAPVTWKALVLFAGGIFLIVKATNDLHLLVEGGAHLPEAGRQPGSLGTAIVQIVAIDLVFSVDSVMTAVGITRDWPVIVLAMLAAMLAMTLAAGPLARFIAAHPTTKALALAFLMLVGVGLCSDGVGIDIPMAVLYGGMAFAVLVEAINLSATRARRKRHSKVPAAIAQDGTTQRAANR